MSEVKKPAWFERAINAEPEWGNVVVDGCSIRYAVWGERGKPGIVLIHGSNAHLEWWRFVAPFLADQFRVVAFDLSGNGDSGWRNVYSGEVFAKETWAVCEDAGLGEFPFVVGHSFGGFVALETGHYFSSELGGLYLPTLRLDRPEIIASGVENTGKKVMAKAGSGPGPHGFMRTSMWHWSVFD